MPPSPAAPAPAGGAPRDAAGAARREAVRAWNGARDLDEIPARVWARWRGAARARRRPPAGGGGAGRPDLRAGGVRQGRPRRTRRGGWALTWRLCATAVAGSRVRVEFVATVVDADARARARGPAPGHGRGRRRRGRRLVRPRRRARRRDGRGARPAGGAGAGARAVPRRRGELDAERVRRRPRRARRAESLPARGRAGLEGVARAGRRGRGPRAAAGPARALRPRAADLADAQRREFAARPDLPPIGAEGDWAAVPARARARVARAPAPAGRGRALGRARRRRRRPVVRRGAAGRAGAATEAVGALGELQARRLAGDGPRSARGRLGAAARARRPRGTPRRRAAPFARCAASRWASRRAPPPRSRRSTRSRPWVSAWLDAASRALAGDAAAAAACVEDAPRRARCRRGVRGPGGRASRASRRTSARRATDALRAWTPAALAAAPAGVRAGLPVLALGRPRRRSTSGRRPRALRDGDAAAVEARARGRRVERGRARAPLRAARPGARRAAARRAPDAARVCQAEWAAAHEARLAEHLRAPAEDADAVDALAYHLEAELRAGDDANAAAFACLLELSRQREAVLARLDAPTRGRVEALVADALRADPPPTDEDRAAFDHFRRTGEVLGAAPPAAAESDASPPVG